MSYCSACGYNDQWSDAMIDVPCQRCGAIKHEDSSVSYDGSRDAIKDIKDRINEFDRKRSDQL